MRSYLIRNLGEPGAGAMWTLITKLPDDETVNIATYLLFPPYQITSGRRARWELHIWRGLSAHRHTEFEDEEQALAFIAKRITEASGRYFRLQGEDLIGDEW